jgi:hypothetical protein
MTQELNIRKGKLTLGSEFVTIDDKNDQRSYRNLMYTAPIWVLFGVLGIYNEGGIFSFFTSVYIFIIVIHTILFFVYLRMSKESHIAVDDIASMKLRNRLGNRFVDIKFHNGKLRRVVGVKAVVSEIQTYIDANFPA